MKFTYRDITYELKTEIENNLPETAANPSAEVKAVQHSGNPTPQRQSVNPPSAKPVTPHQRPGLNGNGQSTPPV